MNIDSLEAGTTYEHIFYEWRLDHESILLRRLGARWLTRGDRTRTVRDEAWRQIQWGEPLFRETFFVV